MSEASASTIWRWLTEDAIKPWQHRSWIFPRDPRFLEKAGPVLDLYAAPLARRAAAPRRVRHLRRREDPDPGAPPQTRRPPRRRRAAAQRVEHEYDRGGALAYLAAWDVHRAKLFGRCEPQTGIDAVRPAGRPGHDHRALRQRAARVLDRRQRLLPPRPGSHRPAPSAGRTCARPPAVHASWLNQIEIYFSVVQRKVLTPNDFATLKRVVDAPRRLRAPLRTDRHAVRVEVHPPRPRRPHRPRRRARAATHARRLIATGLTAATT